MQVTVDIDIPSAQMDQIVDRIAHRIVELLEVEGDKSNQWLDSKQAAEHLGISLNALHRLTSRREIPFAQQSEGGRLYFRPSELDAWRESEYTYAHNGNGSG